MIPKVIHFCWFGRSQYPDLIEDCFASWRRLLPEYDIVEWNENNAELDCSFAKQAYKAKNWAFVSDYVRLVALHRYGGIYLDTDMMLIRSLDPLLKNTCFLGFENPETISAGIIGAEPGNEFILQGIEHYQSSKFNENQLTPIPNILTNMLCKYAPIKYVNQPIQHQVATLYPIDYFYPLPYYEDSQAYLSFVKEETFAVHLWNHSWANEFTHLWQGNYKLGLQKVFKRLKRAPIQPITYYKDLLFHFKRILATKK